MKEAEKGRRLAGEILTVINDTRNTVGPDELPGLKEMAGSGDPHEILSFFCDGKKLEGSVERYKDHEGNSNPDRLSARLNRSRKIRRLRLRVLYPLTGAAVVAFALLIGGLLTNNPQDVEIAETVIDAPVLILGTGGAVDLSGNPLFAVTDLASLVAGDSEDGTDTPVTYNTVIVPSRYTQVIVLADGSTVTINANSRIIYPSRFSGGIREVMLEGEAYFEVSHSESEPFIVRTQAQDVRVYGTSFNINTNLTGVVETTLVEGSVGVTTREGREVMLRPGQMMTLGLADNSVSVESINTFSHTRWKDGYFACDLDPLSVLLDDMSAWYGVSFEADPALGNRRVTVMLDRGMEPEVIMESLRTGLGIEFIKKEGGYMVR